MSAVVAHLTGVLVTDDLVRQLRKAYPYMQFRAEIEESMIYVTGGDPKMHEIVRAFCAGYLAR